MNEMWRVERFLKGMEGEWNRFVEESRNATFLHCRGYMDYHSDRFRDCSWMVYKENRLVALLPANLTEDGTLQSHGGLTYGGWLLPKAHLNGGDLLEIFRVAIEEWKKMGIKVLDYKTVPTIYHVMPSQEDEYALFRLGATLTECNLSTSIDMSIGERLNKLQKRHLAKALKLGVEVEETEDIEGFMGMVEGCLAERHDTKPVHTAGEMRLLKSRFPGQIRFYVAKLDGEAEAGVCIYDTGKVWHAQYIATTPKGREQNMLTPLFHWLLTEGIVGKYAGKQEEGNEACEKIEGCQKKEGEAVEKPGGCRYFDFGISNEEHGRVLNEGLLRQKSSYGGSGVCYRRYKLEL